MIDRKFRLKKFFSGSEISSATTTAKNIFEHHTGKDAATCCPTIAFGLDGPNLLAAYLCGVARLTKMIGIRGQSSLAVVDLFILGQRPYCLDKHRLIEIAKNSYSSSRYNPPNTNAFGLTVPIASRSQITGARTKL